MTIIKKINNRIFKLNLKRPIVLPVDKSKTPTGETVVSSMPAIENIIKKSAASSHELPYRQIMISFEKTKMKPMVGKVIKAIPKIDFL